MQTKKYELTTIKTNFCGRTLYRIKSLIDFNDVKVGDLGGWIENESNLSQTGHCWISYEGKVFDRGEVKDNAIVEDFGQVFDYGKIYDNGRVCRFGKVYDRARVCDNGQVSGQVFGNGVIYGNGKVPEDVCISSGNTDYDVNENIRGLIQNSTNLSFVGNKLIAYIIVKQISKNIFISINEKYKFQKGKYTKGEIYVSNFNYWTQYKQNNSEYIYLAVEVDIKDVISCQKGNIFCKKVKTIGICATK